MTATCSVFPRIASSACLNAGTGTQPGLEPELGLEVVSPATRLWWQCPRRTSA